MIEIDRLKKRDIDSQIERNGEKKLERTMEENDRGERSKESL